MPSLAGYPCCKDARLTQQLQVRGPSVMSMPRVISLLSVMYRAEVLKLEHVVFLP